MMAKETIVAWFKVEMVFEGGRVDDKRDPGGRTCWGVTQRVYNAYRRIRNQSVRDVWLIDSKEVFDIYKTNYWDKIWGDRLPMGLDIVVADGAINSGPSQSVKWLQRALGDLRVDGVMGDATLKAIEACENIDLLIAAVIQRREAFLRALRTFRIYGKGWLSRTKQLKEMGQDVATGTVPLRPIKTQHMGRKAFVEDAKKLPPKLDAVWGAGSGSGILAQLIATLEPLNTVPRIATMLTVLTVIGGLLTVIGVLWSLYARRQTDALRDALDRRPVMPANDNTSAGDEDDGDVPQPPVASEAA